MVFSTALTFTSKDIPWSAARAPQLNIVLHWNLCLLQESVLLINGQGDVVSGIYKTIHTLFIYFLVLFFMCLFSTNPSCKVSSTTDSGAMFVKHPCII